MDSGNPPILVSACLIGRPCRYDGRVVSNQAVSELGRQRQLIAVCPEELGGLGTPRHPAVMTEGDGAAVLDGRDRVLDSAGRDVTAAFIAGAQRALELGRAFGCCEAILKTRSPSCGVGTIRLMDGRLRPGNGVLTELLAREGYRLTPAEAQVEPAQMSP